MKAIMHNSTPQAQKGITYGTDVDGMIDKASILFSNPIFIGIENNAENNIKEIRSIKTPWVWEDLLKQIHKEASRCKTDNASQQRTNTLVIVCGDWMEHLIDHYLNTYYRTCSTTRHRKDMFVQLLSTCDLLIDVGVNVVFIIHINKIDELKKSFLEKWCSFTMFC